MLSVHEASLCKDQITACVNFKCAKQTYSLSANILNHQQQQPVETNPMSSTTTSSSSYQQQNPHIGDNKSKATTNNHNNTSVDDNNNISHSTTTTTTGPLTTSTSLATTTTTKTLNNYMSTVNGRPRSMDFSKYFQVGCCKRVFSRIIFLSKHVYFSL